jgi:hypothetical protein
MRSLSTAAAGRPSSVAVWLATLAGIGMASVGIFMATRDHAPGTDGASTTTASGLAPTEPSAALPDGCTLTQPARRLAPSAQVNTPLLIESSSDSTRTAIGYASTDTRAVGIEVALATLDVEVPFRKAVRTEVMGVVPRRMATSWQFAVDEERPDLAAPRTVAADPPFVLGSTREGIVRRAESGSSVVWPGDNGETTVPRVASVGSTGHAVALRTGGRNGAIRVGWLATDGTARTELTAVEVEPNTELGTPSITASGETTLVSFAAKPASAPAWQIDLAVAPIGKAPERAQPFALPSGGPGGAAISPAATPVPGNHFLLQWTEGSSGARLVRAQRLSSNLVPEGEAVTLSPPGENAGQGALWTAGNRVLALFLVQREARHELWGATLTCR